MKGVIIIPKPSQNRIHSQICFEVPGDRDRPARADIGSFA
jgi:hypothetical protein